MATGLKSAIMMSARSSVWRLARSASGLGSPYWLQVSSDSGERAGAYNGRQQSKQGTFRKRSHQKVSWADLMVQPGVSGLVVFRDTKYDSPGS